MLTQSLLNKIAHLDRKYLLFLGLGIAAFHLWSLMRFPAPFVDEAWLGARAWSFLETGRAFGPLDRGPIELYKEHWTVFSLIPTWFQAFALRLAGTPSLFALRLLSLTFGAILLWAVFSIGKRVGSVWVGVTGVILVAFSRPFLYSSHLARPDIMVAALGYSAFALHLGNVKHKLWLNFFAGALLGIAFDIHPNAILFILPLFFLHFRELGLGLFMQKTFWAAVIGVSVGPIFYISVHMLPNFATYRAVTSTFFGPFYTPPILALDPSIFLESVTNLLQLITVSYLVVGLSLVALAYLVLIKDRDSASNNLIVITLLILGQFLLLNRFAPYFYAISLTPILELTVAYFLILRLEGWLSGSKARKIFVDSAVGIYAIFLVLSFIPLRETPFQDYQQVTRQISEIVAPEDVVMGRSTFWFGLHEHTYLNWLAVWQYRFIHPESTLVEAFQEFRPDIFILDGKFTPFLTDEPPGSLYEKHLPRTALYDLLQNNAVLAGEFYSEFYGPVQVYRFHWEDSK